jgi:hypothetical protein
MEVLDIYFKKGAISPCCKWRHAEVVGRSESEGTITVHYLEWSPNYDEMLHVLFDSNRMRSINEDLPLASVTTSMQFVLESFTKKMAAYEEQLQDELDSLSPSLDSLRTTEYSAASLDLSTYYQSMIRQSNAGSKPGTGQQSQSTPHMDSVSGGNGQNRLIETDEDINRPENVSKVDDQELVLYDEEDHDDDDDYFDYDNNNDDDNFDDNCDDNDNSYLDDDNNDDDYDDEQINSKLRNTREPSSVARHSGGNLLRVNDYDGDNNRRYQVTMNDDDEGSDDSNEAIIMSSDELGNDDIRNYEVMANSNEEGSNDELTIMRNDEVMAIRNYEVMTNSNDEVTVMRNDEVMAIRNYDVMGNSNDEGSNDEVTIRRNDEVMAIRNYEVMTNSNDERDKDENDEVMVIRNYEVITNSNDEGDNDEVTMIRNDEVMAIRNYEVMTNSNDEKDKDENDEVMVIRNYEVMTNSNDEGDNDEMIIMTDEEWSNDEVIDTSSYEIKEQVISHDEEVSLNNQNRKKKKAIFGKLISRFRPKAKDPIINSRIPASDNNDNDGSVHRQTERLLPASDNSAHNRSKAKNNNFFQKLKSIFVPQKQPMSKDDHVETAELSEERSMAIEREIKESQSRKEAAEKMRRDQQFVSALESKGLYVFKIEGDGNCLFRAVSHQLYLNQMRHHELRLKAVDHLIAHRNRFEQFCFDEDFDTHVEEMRKLTTWGDDLEVRALEEITDRLIRIYRSDQDNFDEPSHDDPTEVDLLKDVPPIILSYHGGSHYNSVCDERYRLPLPRRQSRILLESRIASSGVRSSHKSSSNAPIPRKHYNFHPNHNVYYDPRSGSQQSSNQFLYSQPPNTVARRSSHHYNQNIDVMPNSVGAARYGDWSQPHHYSRQVRPYYAPEQAWVAPYTRSSSSADGSSISMLYFGDVSSIISNPHASLLGEESYDSYPYRSTAAPPSAHQHRATQYLNQASSGNSFYMDTEAFDRSAGSTYGLHSRSNVQQYGYYK